MKKVAFLDLDGTLWESEMIPDSALEAIKKARENGHLVLVNTGRAKSTALRPLEGIDLDGYCVSSGAEVIFQGKQIVFHPLGKERAMRLVEELKQREVGFTAEGSLITFADAKNREFFAHHANANRVSSSFKNLPDVEKMQEHDFEQIMKISMNLHPEESISDLLEREGMEFTQFGAKYDEWISGEITDKQYSKATAIAAIKDSMNEPVETIAFGDSENDIPMLKAADISVCMGNGKQSAKEVADFITDTLKNDGLYKAFEKVGLFEKA